MKNVRSVSAASCVVGLCTIAFAFAACRVDDDPSRIENPAEQRVAASDETIEALGVVEWSVVEEDVGEYEIVGTDVHELVLGRFRVETGQSSTEVTMLEPLPGRLELQDGVIVENTMADGALLRHFMEDADPNALVFRDTLGCTVALAAQAAACWAAQQTPPVPPGPKAAATLGCVVAGAAAALACMPPSCDQIACNANCTTAGHTYGWCEADGRCQCYHIGPATAGHEGGDDGGYGEDDGGYGEDDGGYGEDDGGYGDGGYGDGGYGDGGGGGGGGYGDEGYGDDYGSEEIDFVPEFDLRANQAIPQGPDAGPTMTEPLDPSPWNLPRRR